MKIKTLESLKTYQEDNKIVFQDDGVCVFNLTKGQVCDIIQLEFGIRPKKTRIIKKKLSNIVNSILAIVLEEIRNGNSAIVLSS